MRLAQIVALATDSYNSSNFGVKMSEILHFPGKSLGRSPDSCFSALTITPEMGPGGYLGLGGPTEWQVLRSLTPGSTPGVQHLSRHAAKNFSVNKLTTLMGSPSPLIRKQ